MPPYPQWFEILSWSYLGVCFLCVLVMLADEAAGNWQQMLIMNLVWPITALYWGPAALWGYFTAGRKMTRRHKQQQMGSQKHQGDAQAEANPHEASSRAQGAKEGKPTEPTSSQVAVADTHCGAGCTLGDIGAEWWVALMGLAFTGGDFTTRILMDFLLAWSFGVAFQYFTIVPMRGLSVGRGIVEAIRADTLSIVAFQMGLFGWMALTYYVIFPGPHLHVTEAPFWFMMQVGMILGFFTAYPVNLLLLQSGWKEKMG
jgi:hypothetical protein